MNGGEVQIDDSKETHKFEREQFFEQVDKYISQEIKQIVNDMDLRFLFQFAYQLLRQDPQKTYLSYLMKNCLHPTILYQIIDSNYWCSASKQMLIHKDRFFRMLIHVIEHRKPWILQATKPDSQNSELLQTFDHVKGGNFEHRFQFLIREKGDFYIQTPDGHRLVSNNGVVEQTHWLKSFIFMKKQYKPVIAKESFKHFETENANSWCFFRMNEFVVNDEQNRGGANQSSSCLYLHLPPAQTTQGAPQADMANTYPRLSTPLLNLPQTPPPYPCMISLTSTEQPDQAGIKIIMEQ